MAQLAKSVLWVDDDAELLEPHRKFLRAKGIRVDVATNAEEPVTSNHGTIHCRTPTTVLAKCDATQKLRYKFGEDLRAEIPEQGLSFTNEDSLKLPRRDIGATTLLATGHSFVVHPTKLREHQSRYRGCFLHGGVKPEECIRHVALLTPRR